MIYNMMDFKKLESNIDEITKTFSFSEVFSCGESELGKNLYCIKFGIGSKKIFLNGAHHALEWITSSLLVNFVYDFCLSVRDNTKLMDTDTNNIFEMCTFYVLPMVNPDGVDIVINGIDLNHPKHESIEKMLNGRDVRKVWQANINGVDLNHNYDAYFYEGKRLEKENGVYGPGPTRFSGNTPFSENETIAVKGLQLKNNFDVSVAFHSQGEVIYYSVGDNIAFRNKAKRFAKVSGYELDDAIGISACSGYKDWVILKFGKPAFTVEVGLGKNPVEFDQFEKIKNDNYRLILECANI